MTKEVQGERHPDAPDLRRQGRAAVEGPQATREAVRDVVMRALSNRSLEEGQVRDVVRSVLEGAAEAAPDDSAESLDALRQALAGIDDALERAAIASKLAIEEARARAAAFSEQDLRRAVDDLATLDRLYFEALASVVKSGTKVSARIIGDLADHLRRTGTRTGAAVREALGSLERAHPTHVPPHPSEVARSARAGAATIAAIGSGILAGLADTLGHRHDEDRTERPEEDV
ncbi:MULTISPECIES: DUF6781 family protein [unclassified Aliiroseovarius]|uniref:DUF6781 family protein n=1 Tax=unclassified Aliiroseovarius TaxID=2623558 RepID=UPI0015688B7D|nr:MULTISPECIES: DUF6781 family protein [unclassified Aliiroseovarius]NRP31695.1 hypothetical protein [Aliiroseovarius sp. xm-m-314]NRP81337.1 hypothetical protein [Aliiroseovarius sp. xm-v-209]NRQ11777.1 hypothetical protein [Aliiroseovarius sp. xm-v-208]